MTIAYYHSKDLDDLACGAIIQQAFAANPTAIMMRGYDYGEPFNIEEHAGRDVIMADVSLPIKDMIALNKVAKSFTWIDHHATAINEFTANEEEFIGVGNFKYYLVVGTAACVLTWEKYWSYISLSRQQLYGAERVIRLLGEYDVWKQNVNFDWENETLPFQYGMRSICNKIEDFPTLLKINNTFADHVIAQGKAILHYQEQQNEIRCRAAFETELFGLRAICLNCPGLNSIAFKSVYDPEKHDIIVPFNYENGKWKFSLYTDKDIDVSQIAKSMGGGGHKQAAGFKVSHLSQVFVGFKAF